jgi:hypothetical protein
VKPWFLAVSALVAAAGGGTASAADVLLQNSVVTCVATTHDTVRMWIDGAGFVLNADHSAAHARVHLQRRDQSEVEYAVSGKADRIEKTLAPNSGGRSIAYGGIECTISHRNVISVHDCRGTAGHRTCEVGLDFEGARHAYLVSLSIRPLTATGSGAVKLHR